MTNRKIFFILAAVIFCVSEVRSQELFSITKSEFCGEKKEECEESWKELQKGMQIYVEGEGLYPEAREKFLEAYKFNSDNPKLNYMLGVCYLFTDNKSEAVKYLKKAYDLDNDVAKDIHYMLGKAYHIINDFQNAINEYKYAQTIYPSKNVYEMREWSVKVQNLIDQCETGKKMIQSPVRCMITNAGKEINSQYDDYGPVFQKFDSIMYFTSRRISQEVKCHRSGVDNKIYEDVYYSVKKGNNWNNATRCGKPLNESDAFNNENNAAVYVSKDGTRVYMYRGEKNNGDIYVNTFKDGIWKNAKPITSQATSENRERSMCFTPDENELYFVSIRKGKEDIGGSDIFVVKKNEKGNWMSPQNLGPVINTKFEEMGVFISSDNKRMYFSSNGHPGMGGYDVFVSERGPNGAWQTPKNIGYPVNTSDDELFYVTGDDERYAYYSTKRNNCEGGFDIYKITYLGSEKEMLTCFNSVVNAGRSINEGIFFKVPGLISIDSTISMKGFIFDEKSSEPVVAKIQLIDQEKSQTIATSISGNDGSYKLTIPEKKIYGIEVAAPEYMMYLENIDISNAPKNVLSKDFRIKKIEVGVKVILNNIFFDSGKWTIKPESYRELESVRNLLEDNSTIRVEISGHTDNQGSDSYNKTLSNNRAKSVVEYLISKGIDASRLEYKGYGFDQPVATNDTPEGRQLNRRVEFKVIGK